MSIKILQINNAHIFKLDNLKIKYRKESMFKHK